MNWPLSRPVFSPDGRYLAVYHQTSVDGGYLATFIPNYAAAPQLDSTSGRTRILNLTNGKWSNLGSPSGAGSMPSWSETGDKLTWQLNNSTFATASALRPAKVTVIHIQPGGYGFYGHGYPSWVLGWPITPYFADEVRHNSAWDLEEQSLHGRQARTVAARLWLIYPADLQLDLPPPFPLVLGNTIVCAVSAGDESAYVQRRTIRYLPGLPYGFQFLSRHRSLLVSWYDNFSIHEHVGTGSGDMVSRHSPKHPTHCGSQDGARKGSYVRPGLGQDDWPTAAGRSSEFESFSYYGSPDRCRRVSQTLARTRGPHNPPRRDNVSLRTWWRIAQEADWNNFDDVQKTFNRADLVGERVIFDVRGGYYRLVTWIDFDRKLLVMKWFGTHAEYDRKEWE